MNPKKNNLHKCECIPKHRDILISFEGYTLVRRLSRKQLTSLSIHLQKGGVLEVYRLTVHDKSKRSLIVGTKNGLE